MRARSWPMSRRGAGRAAALLDRGRVHVPAAEVWSHLDGFAARPIVVEQRAARDVIQLEAYRLASVGRELPPMPVRPPRGNDRTGGIDGEVVDLGRAHPDCYRPLPLSHQGLDACEPPRRRRGTAREHGHDHQNECRATGAGAHRDGLCQRAWPTKKGPRLAMYSDVWTVLRMVCTRCDSGCSSLPTRPIRKSLS